MNTSPKHAKLAAFTLTEMLVVVVLISILMVMAAPAIRNLTGTKGVVNAMNGVAGLIKYARNEAQNRQTYTWVGFNNSNNTSQGYHEAEVMVFMSLDGSTNVASANITNITRLERFENTKFTNGNTLNTNATDIMSQTPPSTRSYADPSSGLTVNFSKYLVFTPGGQALLPQSGDNIATVGYVNMATIGIIGTKGTNVSSSGNKGNIDISGGSGSVRIGVITNQ